MDQFYHRSPSMFTLQSAQGGAEMSILVSYICANIPRKCQGVKRDVHKQTCVRTYVYICPCVYVYLGKRLVLFANSLQLRICPGIPIRRTASSLPLSPPISQISDICACTLIRWPIRSLRVKETVKKLTRRQYNCYVHIRAINTRTVVFPRTSNR